MSTPKVLVVDDDASILKAVRRLLHNEAFETTVTGSPREALKLVARESYAVVLSDYRMPEMTGAGLLGKVREISPDTVRIMLTGYPDVQAAVEAIQHGAVYRFITKPWNGEELRLTLREAVAQHELIRGHRRQRRLNGAPHHGFMGSIGILAQLAEIHSPLVGSHSRRVTALCRDVGRQLKLANHDLLDLSVAATLHDIGKIDCPAQLLKKPREALTPHQRDLLKNHVIRGQAIAETVPNPGDTPRLIRHHHESFDGQGYPDRLKGAAIPLASRIIAAVDAYDNHLNRRATFELATPAETLRHLEGQCSSLLDPEVFGALAACVHRGERRRTEESQVDVRPGDLREGMVLSRDLRTLGGVLLLPKDTALRANHLACLRKHREKDPVADRIYVYRRIGSAASGKAGRARHSGETGGMRQHAGGRSAVGRGTRLSGWPAP